MGRSVEPSKGEMVPATGSRTDDRGCGNRRYMIVTWASHDHTRPGVVLEQRTGVHESVGT